MFESGRVALTDVWEWSGGPPGCPGVVRMSSQMTRSGQEALPDTTLGHWESLPTTPGQPGGPLNTPRHPVGSPDHSRTIEIAFRPVPDIQKAFLPLLNIREGLPTTLSHP